MRRLYPAALVAIGVVVAASQLPARGRPLAALAAAAARKGPKPYDEPAKAWEFYARKRAPVGQTALPTERYVAAQERMGAMRRYSTRLGRFLPRPKAGLTAAAGALGTWSPLGPGNIGGRTRALLIDPGAPNTMYAAGVAGGVWKTTNGGAAWTPLDDFMANLAVNAMAMDPGNSGVLYAGTGEGFFNGDAVRGAGIFKTTNGGTTWAVLANTVNANFHYVNDVIVSSNNSQRVYAATRTGVWRSLNGGVNWTRILTTGLAGGCLDLLQRPGGPADEVFASCGSFGGAEVRRSASADTGAAFGVVLTEASMGRTSLAIAPSDPNVLYALSASDDAGSANYYLGLHAVFRSTNGGLDLGRAGEEHQPDQAQHAAPHQPGHRLPQRVRLRLEQLLEPGLVRQRDRGGSGRSPTRVGGRDRPLPLGQRRRELGPRVLLVARHHRSVLRPRRPARHRLPPRLRRDHQQDDVRGQRRRGLPHRRRPRRGGHGASWPRATPRTPPSPGRSATTATG